MSTKIELLIQHGMNLCGIEDIWKICYHCCYTHVSHTPATLGMLIKYGALEKMPISLSSLVHDDKLLRKYFFLNSTDTLHTNRVKDLYLKYFPKAEKKDFTEEQFLLNLSNLCRWTVRQTLAQRRHIVHWKDICQLPIPERLQRFLMYEATGKASKSKTARTVSGSAKRPRRVLRWTCSSKKSGVTVYDIWLHCIHNHTQYQASVTGLHWSSFSNVFNKVYNMALPCWVKVQEKWTIYHAFYHFFTFVCAKLFRSVFETLDLIQLEGHTWLFELVIFTTFLFSFNCISSFCCDTASMCVILHIAW